MTLYKQNLILEQQFLVLAVSCNEKRQLSEEIESIYSQVGDRCAFDAAKLNRVESIVAHTLMDILGEANIPAHWLKAHDTVKDVICTYLAELDWIATLLSEKNIPVIALKNGGIARGIYTCAGCCPMGDLDILVDKQHFRTAHKILIDLNYHFEFRSPLEKVELDEAENSGSAEYWKTLLNGNRVWLELQWRPVSGRWIRPDQEPKVEELFARSILIHGSKVRLLSPEDNLLQVALHTAKHSYVRAPGFRLHLDVDRIVRKQKIDWDMFLKRVLALQVKTAVFFSLAISKYLLDTPIPEEVLTQVKPALWKERLINLLLQHAGLFNPDESKFNKLEYIIFNALLYDNLRGLKRGIIPEKESVIKSYNIKNEVYLPYYYMRRILSLAFRHVRT